jgi:hypothetical protein
MPPVFSSRNSTFVQLLPPSVDRKIPRSELGAAWWPKAATNTMSGLVGWTRILEMFCDSTSPICAHVLPPSVDL